MRLRCLDQNPTVSGVVLQNLTYTWDALGNQTSRRDQGVLSAANNTYKDLKQNFCYDGLNRLIKTHENSLNGSCSMTVAQGKTGTDLFFKGVSDATEGESDRTELPASYCAAGPQSKCGFYK